MAKDPAINWYFDNWSGGTKGFSRHQKGCYMDLLEAQFYLGHLSLEQIKNILGPDFSQWNFLCEKFTDNGQGKFFNERMELEKEKRRLFSIKQSKNGQKGGRPKTQTKPNKNPSLNPNESLYETETGIASGIDDLKGLQRETFEEKFKTAFDEITLESYRIKYKFLDLVSELEHFRLKCDSNPNEYHTRDPAGLRMGFLKQLKGESNKPKINGTNGSTKNTASAEIIPRKRDFKQTW